MSNVLKDGRIEIDNNLLENAIRPFALGRKNWLFMGSPAGAEAGAIFYSLIETCKASGIDYTSISARCYIKFGNVPPRLITTNCCRSLSRFNYFTRDNKQTTSR